MKNFKVVCLGISIIFLSNLSFSQSPKIYSDSIKNEILALQYDVKEIQLNLSKAQPKLQIGIITATLGYAITIAGGQMLGRENDDLGQVLLYTGGAVGISGTVLLIDSFKYIGKAGGRGRKRAGN
ncbi:MAG: hypothetical protein KTR26_00680 [Flammeovirgaceae bacterium]|nr:hypothetical protein [Flammeovirgaceae bacterium]